MKDGKIFNDQKLAGEDAAQSNYVTLGGDHYLLGDKVQFVSKRTADKLAREEAEKRRAAVLAKLDPEDRKILEG